MPHDLQLEKGREIGAHTLSGAILDPIALKLIPDYQQLGAPLATPVTGDAIYFLTSHHKVLSPSFRLR